MEEKKSGIKKFLEEFKAFAMRGNVLDMAVALSSAVPSPPSSPRWWRTLSTR